MGYRARGPVGGRAPQTAAPREQDAEPDCTSAGAVDKPRRHGSPPNPAFYTQSTWLCRQGKLSQHAPI
eukprot:9177736-Lingulodinium_polyedra.AAC.1